MIRIKSSTQTKLYNKKILKMAKGYRGRAKSCYTVAIERVEKGLQYAYAHRKLKKRSFRALWIQRINAGCMENMHKYSTLISDMHTKNILINRKILSEIAYLEPYTFKALLYTSTIN